MRTKQYLFAHTARKSSIWTQIKRKKCNMWTHIKQKTQYCCSIDVPIMLEKHITQKSSGSFPSAHADSHFSRMAIQSFA